MYCIISRFSSNNVCVFGLCIYFFNSHSVFLLTLCTPLTLSSFTQCMLSLRAPPPLLFVVICVCDQCTTTYHCCAPHTHYRTPYVGEQKPEEVAKIEEPIQLPKLRKVAVAPKEEPKKIEVKKTKVKIPKAKKYEELPEIPDYERPELEVYEASDFDPNKASEEARHAVPTPADPMAAVAQQATVGQSTYEPKKNGLSKVRHPQRRTRTPLSPLNVSRI